MHVPTSLLLLTSTLLTSALPLAVPAEAKDDILSPYVNSFYKKDGGVGEEISPYVNSYYKRKDDKEDKISPYVNSYYKRVEAKEDKISPYVNSFYKRDSEAVEDTKVSPYVNSYYKREPNGDLADYGLVSLSKKNVEQK